jgi:hypothetical protein
MTGDQINSIDDTPLSSQIAIEAKNVYYDLITSKPGGWPHLQIETQLEGLGLTTRPTHMRIPEMVNEVYFIKYDASLTGATTITYKDVLYKSPKDFLDYVHARDSSADNIDIVTTVQNVKLFIINDQAPTYWTSFDDEYIVFDSYDSEVDSSLQTAKSVIGASKEPTWTHSDTFIPDLPSGQFPLFLAELTSVSHIYFAQQQSIVDGKRALRQRAVNNNDTRSNGEKRHNFGRK